MESNQEMFDVVIIGAGIAGSSTAYYCAKSGVRTLLLDQYDFLHANGSSGGQSRIVRTLYPSLEYTRTCMDAIKMWRHLESATDTKLLSTSGGLDICRENSEVLNQLVSAAKRGNLQYELLNHEEINKKFPAYNISKGYMGVYTPDACIIHPTKAVNMFLELGRKHGLTLRDNTKVLDIKNTNGMVMIQTQNGLIKTPKCIIATGAWSKEIMSRCFNLNLNLIAKNILVTYWRSTNTSLGEYPYVLTHDIFDGKEALYSTPTMEYPGTVKFGVHGGFPIADMEKRSFEPDHSLIHQYLKPFLKTEMKTINYDKPAIEEMCLYTVTPDEEFIMDRLPENPNIIVAFGFSGYGFKFGPLLGRVLAEMVFNQESELTKEFRKNYSISRPGIINPKPKL